MSYLQFRPKVDRPAQELLAAGRRRDILERLAAMQAPARRILEAHAAKKFPTLTNILLDKPTNQP